MVVSRFCPVLLALWELDDEEYAMYDPLSVCKLLLKSCMLAATMRLHTKKQGMTFRQVFQALPTPVEDTSPCVGLLIAEFL